MRQRVLINDESANFQCGISIAYLHMEGNQAIIWKIFDDPFKNNYGN